MSTIKTLLDLSEKDFTRIGGKATSLVKMKKAGFNVPNAFVIPIDTEISSEDIMHAFDNLNSDYVAVRSSATVEDGEKDSWAGQFSSYLNVTRDKLLEHILLVKESINTLRANTYSTKINIDNIKMAVIIQEMVDADASGVAFSKNPLNTNDTIIIEGGLGLGELVVSGMITPDYYEVDKENFEVVTKKINNQTKKLTKIGYQNINNEIQKVSNEQIITIAKEISKLENYFKMPIDVEWAISNDTLYILQARPITTLELSGVNKIIQKLSKQGNYFVEGTGIYFSWLVEDALIKATTKEMQEKVFKFSIPFTGFVVINGDEYIASESNVATIDTFKEKYNSEGISFLQNHFNDMLKLCDETERYRKELVTVDFSAKSTLELKKIFQEFFGFFLEIFTSGTMEPSAMLEDVLYEELSKIIPNNELEQALSIIKTKSPIRDLDYVDEPLKLLYLAKEVKKEYKDSFPQKLSDHFIEKLNNHINEYGYLQDLPEFYGDTKPSLDYYIDRIKYFFNINIDERISDILKARENVEKEYEGFLNKYKITDNLKKLFDTVRVCIMMRTYKVSFTDKLYYTGKYLGLFDAVAKSLDISVDDLQAMSIDEIIKAFDIGTINVDFKARQDGYYMIWNESGVDIGFGEEAAILQKYMSDKYQIVSEDNEELSQTIKGQIANMGIVKGRVKIVTSIEDMVKFNEGDILVTTMTRPEFIPAMEKAIGFITNEGGMTCHAAIVSREFDVPCIVGTVAATKVLKDGDYIELNAMNGTVKIIQENN